MDFLLKLYLVCLSLSLLIFSGCFQKSVENDKESFFFTIRGKLENNDSDQIYLSAFGDPEFIVTDSAIVEPDGSFQFNGNINEPEIYRISGSSPNNSLMLVVDSHQIEVHADAKELAYDYEVKGSEESLRMKELLNILQNHLEGLALVETKFNKALQAGDSDSLLYYREQHLSLETENVTRVKKFIRKYPSSIVATYPAFSMIDIETEAQFLDSMLMVFNKNIPDSKYVKVLGSRRGASSALAIGSPAPDISLDQPDGTPLSLASLKGKYVLIDFWASWCRPCRQENPHLVKLYNRFKAKGFEIFAVSLDESRDRWIEAIQNDGLKWYHVSDLKGAASSAAQLYKVEAIPMSVLLDKEGKIIALNLRGTSLEEKMEELLGGE